MSLDFLSVTGVDAVARSPMEASAAAEGARFEVRDGWNVAVDFGRSPDDEARAAAQTVGWADVSQLPKFELQGSEAQHGEFGVAERRDGAWWCRLTPTRALVIGAVAPSGLDVTTSYAALTIAGPLAREVFARFSAIDLRPKVTPVGALRPGSVARQPGIVICEAEDRYLYLFGWATGEYVWSVVADAGHHLSGRPMGIDALASLPGPVYEPEASRA